MRTGQTAWGENGAGGMGNGVGVKTGQGEMETGQTGWGENGAGDVPSSSRPSARCEVSPAPAGQLGVPSGRGGRELDSVGSTHHPLTQRTRQC